MIRLFCKYEAGRSHSVYGHRGDISYEALVYRNVLVPSKATTAKFYGEYTDTTTRSKWLVIDYLEKSVRVSKTPEPEAMRLASRWIAQFHAANELHRSTPSVRSLKTYDAEYYLGWVRRTLLFARNLQERFRWLPILCKRFEKSVVPLLLKMPMTVTHGEYYPRNILYSKRTIYPVDWESAAVAVGEIDLASLTEEWPAKTVRQCEDEYLRTRWPEGSPPDFERAMGAARLYLLFRWLGDRPEWTTDADALRSFKRLRRAGEQWGLI
jgi:thiamine kinase-like enzyme